MTRAEIKARQKVERQKYLDAILKSKAEKKLIIAGPGTGKTFTFGQVLKQNAGDNNIAMTFIRKLVKDMETDLGRYAEVKTFHAYCKKILHEQNGRVQLIPYLTKIIERDAELLGKDLQGFDVKFQTLDEHSVEIVFYLSRGDYYEVVSFNDSVYRLYKLLQKDPDILQLFNQIVIDEYQDFNPLEVAFIDELEKKGPIIIVGDDDQAVYNDRSASPVHLRRKHKSRDFVVFELPFCSRCPEVIVSATNALVDAAQSSGCLAGRITKRYECYLEDKEQDSAKYSRIIVARCTTAKVIPQYISKEISEIDPGDIAESYIAGKKYPTILIVGPRQYLRETEKQLRPVYPQLSYSPSIDMEYGIIEAYELILKNQNSNLGWRILMECFCDLEEQREILDATENGVAMIDLLDSDFVATHLKAIAIIRTIQNEEQLTSDLEAELRSIVGDDLDQVIKHFTPVENEDEPEVDNTQPSILLTSYKGCKGLSAGHVFIIGANDGSMPKDSGRIEDVEISQFIVALTRTRKQCHVISNKWLFSPKSSEGRWVPPFDKSVFISWIPQSLLEDKGEITAGSLR